MGAREICIQEDLYRGQEPVPSYPPKLTALDASINEGEVARSTKTFDDAFKVDRGETVTFMAPRVDRTGQRLLCSYGDFEQSTWFWERLVSRLGELLVEIQENMLCQAANFRHENTRQAQSYEEFKETIEQKRGFVVAPWDGSEETEQKIKEDTKATIRLLPFERREGKDLVSGKPGETAIFARAY